MKVTTKILYWLTVALLIYMPFHIFLSQWLSVYTGGLEVWKIAKDVVTAVLVTGLVGVVLLTRKFTRTYLVLLAVALIYLFLHLLLFITTSQPIETGFLATTYNNRLIWYVLIGYSLAIIMPKTALDRRFAKILVAVAGLVALIGLAQWFLPKDILTYFGYSIERGARPAFFIDDKPDLPRLFATLRDPNSLGAFLILPSTIVILSLQKYWGTSRRTFLLGLELLFGLIILLSFSRSAWIGVFIAHGLALTYVFRNQLKVLLRRFIIPIVAVTLLLGMGFYAARDQYFIQNVILHSDENTTQASSNDLHIIQIQKGIDGIEDYPLGQGPGTAGLVSTKLKNGLITENYFVQIAYEVGVFGLLIFLAFLGLLLRCLWSRRQDMLPQALIASFVGLVFMNMLLHTWSNEAVAISWFLLAGIAVGLTSKNKR